VTGHDWEASAACAQIGGGMWDTADGPHVFEAIAICATCPVRQQCLDDALAREGRKKARYRAGIWGGLGPAERARLARTKEGISA
jgi:WhiB family transcriptional regulator, redox-sensing transcriptional regulator